MECSELTCKNVCLPVCFFPLNLCVQFVVFIYINVCVKKRHTSHCDISHSKFMELCFVFKSYKNLICWSLQPANIKNISSMNLK